MISRKGLCRRLKTGLSRLRESETLLQARARLQEHLRNNAANAARKEFLLKADAALEAKDTRQHGACSKRAIGTLGLDEDFEHLLALTNREQSEQEQESAEVRDASAIPKG